MNIDNKIERPSIESLQSLRAIAFLFIFLRHVKVVGEGLSSIGVSIFFVLSGFLMMYKYNDREMSVSLKDNFKFSISKISKVYPLHILTMIFVVFLTIVNMLNGGEVASSVVSLLGQIFANVTLLQTWIPYKNLNFSLNGVAWYLSVAFFLYFVFPYILNFVRKLKKIWKAVGVCIIILVLQIVLSMIVFKFQGTHKNLFIWFPYCFPIFRIGDLFMGCTLGYIYLNKSKINISTLSATILETISLIGTVICIILIEKQSCELVGGVVNPTTICIVLAAVWIYLFTINKGIITKILCNRPLRFIGNISAYTFLIHTVIIKYTAFVVEQLGVEVSTGMNILLIILQFVLTIIATLIYLKFKKIKVKY